MGDHGDNSFGRIAAYPILPEDYSKSKIEFSLQGETLSFYSDGRLKVNEIDAMKFNAYTLGANTLTVNNAWYLKDVPLVEGGEVVEGLTEFILESELNNNPVIRISNQAKEQSFVISEESYIGLGTKWPSVKLDVNGGVQGTSAYSAASDRRLKKNIQNITQTDALQVLNKLQGVTFDWKAKFIENKEYEIDVENNPGFIAQQVEMILPQLVSTNKQKYKSVKYSGVIPYLVEAIKNLQTRIEDLEQNCTL